MTTLDTTTTINTPILTNREQYHSELAQLPRLSTEDQEAQETLARAGDKSAQERLIFEGMHFVERVANLYTATYLRPDDYLDLIQVGNLALIEHLDKTLSAGKGIGYLCVIARKSMRYYLLYRSRIIALPMNRALPQKFPTIVSLESLTHEARIQVEELLTSLIEKSDQPDAFNALYGPLQQAMQELPENQREMITRRHGLDGAPTESLGDISKQLSISNAAGSYRYHTGLKKLRASLKRA